jgi:hypothetical protein
MICADAELSRLDLELGRLYELALKQAPKPEILLEQQRTWLKERDQCADVAGLRLSYQDRIDQLTFSDPATIAATYPFNSEETCLEPHINWSDYQWVLLSGKGQPACEAMFAYLTSRPADAPPPVCPEERLPPNSDWTRPTGRDLNETERQNLIDGLPPSPYHRQKPGGPVSVESNFRHAKLLRVLHADISRDGIPENLLAYASHDYRHECWRATHCVRAEEPYNREIAIAGGSTYNYKLLPMNDEGTQVNWQHPTASNPPMLNIGELVYYQGRPFWLSYPVWFQKASGYPGDAMTISDLLMFHKQIFNLNALGHSVIGQHGGPVQPAPFEKVRHIRGDGGEGCSFGYFHREYIKRNLHSEGIKP